MDSQLLLPVILALTFAMAAVAGTVFVLAAQINNASGRRGTEPRCPSCGVRDARTSGQRTLRDFIFGWFSCMPFRCRQCAGRFYWYVERARNLNNAV